jgi:hypothetical protein
MTRTISLRETQSVYAVSLDKTELTDEPVYIERYGKFWAVLVPIAQFQQLLTLQKQYQTEVAQHATDAAWCQEQLTALSMERATFQRLLPELLKTHIGKFVAIQGERVIDSADDESALAQRTRERGYRPVYIERVTQTPTVVEFSSPEDIHGAL